MFIIIGNFKELCPSYLRGLFVGWGFWRDCFSPVTGLALIFEAAFPPMSVGHRAERI